MPEIARLPRGATSPLGVMRNKRTGNTEIYDQAQRRCTVIGVGRRDLLLEHSPLRPSCPAFPGDQGWAGTIRVNDVLNADRGRLHLLACPHHLCPGDQVEVVADLDRRRRIARTHAAAILVIAELGRRGVEVLGIEITSGLAWIEVPRDPGPLPLDAAIECDRSLRAHQAGPDRQLVLADGVVVATFPGPLLRTAGELAGTTVTGIGPDSDGPFVLEISLPGGRWRWWR